MNILDIIQNQPYVEDPVTLSFQECYEHLHFLFISFILSQGSSTLEGPIYGSNRNI